MELRQLEYFRTVARHGNISRAAEELFVSQPSISKSLQNLEKELGTSLFDRIGKQIVLNKAGEAALEYTNHIFTTLDAMKSSLSRFSPGNQLLNICTNIPFLMRYLMPQFTLEHNEITFNTFFIGQYRLNGALLAERAYDMVFSGEPLEGSGIVNVPVYTDYPVLCVPKQHPLSSEKRITLAQLQSLPILLPETIQDGFHFRYIRDYLKKEGIQPNYVVLPDVGAARYLFAKTDACSIQSQLTMRFHRYEGALYLPIDAPKFCFNYYISYQKDHIPQVEVFLNWIQANLSSK